MSKRIIALIGGPGSGKTTSAEYLRKQGYTSFALSDVRQISALAHNVDVDDFDEMREFTRVFYEQRGRAIFADFTLHLIKANDVRDVVLEGVRDPDSMAKVKSYCDEQGWALYCVGIRTDPLTAARRIELRGRKKDPHDFASILKYTNARAENVEKTMIFCDEIVVNDGAVEQLYSSLCRIAKNLEFAAR